jgi:hypothetical protein
LRHKKRVAGGVEAIKAHLQQQQQQQQQLKG